MIRTRHVAGTVALALLSLPFMGVSPASAAAGEVSVTGPLYTGNTETITFVDGDETGAYAVELWQTAKVATLATGTDITALGTSMKWTIPTGLTALVGTGFKVKVVPGTGATFTAIETSTFAISSSAVDTVAITGSPTTWSAGVAKTITWDRKGQTGGKVDIAIVSSAGKVTVIEKASANDETESIVLPLKTALATGYKVRVTPSNKAATLGESSAVEVTAATAPTVAVDDSTPTRGQLIEVTPTSVSGPVQLDLVLTSAPTKSVAKIAKAAASGDVVEFVIPAKLAAGDYKVLATVVGSKPATTGLSSSLTVATLPAITLDGDTATALADGVTTGQTLTIDWTTDVDGLMIVSLFAADKETKLDSKALTVAGAGTYEWVASTKLVAGATYKIQVAYAADPTVKVQSSAFTVTVNPTTLVAA